MPGLLLALRPLGLLLLFSLIISPIALAGTVEQDAFRALRILDGRTDSGISYKEFMSEWGQTNGLVNIAIEDTKNKAARVQLSKIKQVYSDAAILWKCAIQMKKVNSFVIKCIDINDQDFKARNPSEYSVIRDGVDRFDFESPEVTASISGLFTRASKEIRSLKSVVLP